MKFLQLFILLLSTHICFGQLDSLSHFEYGVRANDVWGYEDEFGNEYALVGLYDGVSIVNISDPSDPIEVYRSYGPETIWRDIKVYNDFAYVTNEADSGMRIYDLSGLPSDPSVPFKNFSGESGKEFTTAHNVFIDERGRAFVVGTDRNQGMIVYDLTSDPWNPSEIGFYDQVYIHDIYVENDTAYPSVIIDGDFYVLDVSQDSVFNFVGSHPTKALQTHNTWLSSDGNYLYTTDETDGAEVGVYDISDRSDPEKVEFFKSRLLGDEMPHNVVVKDSLVFISYYREGVVLLDGSNPENLIELSRFDSDKTKSGPGSGGNWGVYPFFSSGNIIISDIFEGLYVLGYNALSASYLEGVVKDESTGFPLTGVVVKVLNEGKEDKTSFNGEYKVGQIGSGVIKVAFSLFGYEKDTIEVVITENQIVAKDVLLKKKEIKQLKVNVSLSNGASADGIEVTVSGEGIFLQETTNDDGNVNITVPQGEYIVYAGKWGYNNNCMIKSVTQEYDSVELKLKEGIFDDFSSNQGWEVFSVQKDPVWERGIPVASYDNHSFVQSDPGADATEGDCNDWAYCTGINGAFSSSSTTINWTNYLVSPMVELGNSAIDVKVSWSYWLGMSSNSNDSVKFGVIIGADTIYNNVFTSNDELLEWNDASFNLLEIHSELTPFRFIVRITDDLAPWDIVDAAVDDFRVDFIEGEESLEVGCFQKVASGWKSTCGEKDIKIYNSLGQLVKYDHSDVFSLDGLNVGVYIVVVDNNIAQKIFWND